MFVYEFVRIFYCNFVLYFYMVGMKLVSPEHWENTFISFGYPKAFIYYQSQLPIFNFIDNNTVIMHA
jgi:hypothetical protein